MFTDILAYLPIGWVPNRHSLQVRTNHQRGSHLLNLPPSILERIVRLAASPPIPAGTTTLLLICPEIQRITYRVFRSSIDLSHDHTTTSTFLRAALTIDPLFGERVEQYLYPAKNKNLFQPFTQLHHSVAVYPLDPDNSLAFASRQVGPAFRSYVWEMRIRSTWDIISSIKPSWGSNSTRGVPFGALPVFLDCARHAFPQLRTLRIDAPKTTNTTLGEQDRVSVVARDTLVALSRYSRLLLLDLDCWALGDDELSTIILSCCSLEVLLVRRVILTGSVPAIHLPLTAINSHLRRLTLIDSTLSYESIPLLLKTFISLESLQIMGYSISNHTYDLDTFVGECLALQRRFADTSTGSSLRTLVLRPSYRLPIAPSNDRVVRVVALLVALSPKLRRLHLGIHLADSLSLLPLQWQAFERLDSLWIGFMSAQDEVGEAVRLSVADDRRIRAGLRRGGDVDGDEDPLAVPQSESTHPTLPYRGTGFNERLVLGRLRLNEEFFVRFLVDRTFLPTSMNLTSAGRLASLLKPYPHLIQLVNQPPRKSILRRLFIFETEYVSALERLRQHGSPNGGAVGGWAGPGIRENNSSDAAWDALMMGAQGL
ncbi:hypothetical protein T439DRAFT_355017 [Meredithblackwellia eburnea MCA 4105]